MTPRTTIAGKMHDAALKAYDVGLGPDDRPWAVSREHPSVKYCLTHGPELKVFHDKVLIEYIKQGNGPADARHVKTAVDGLVALARSRELEEGRVTEGDVEDRKPPQLSADAQALMATGINLDDGSVAVVHAVLEAIGGREDIFVGGHSLTRAIRDHDHRINLAPMVRPAELVNWCDRWGVRFYVAGEEAAYPTEEFLPESYARLVLNRGEYDMVPKLVGVSRIPVIRPDGTVAVMDGYDAASEQYLDVDEDLRDLKIPEKPTDRQVAQAAKYVTNLYATFPFGLRHDTEERQDASRANAIGLLITVVMKTLHPTMLVPLHIADAGQRGSGKSLVAMELPGLVAGGHGQLTFVEEEPELRKRVTTEMVASSVRVLCFDNVIERNLFESGVIAQLLTSTIWEDRMLGSNTKASRPQDRIWTATGNNVRVGPDLQARSVPIILDPDEINPAARSFKLSLDDVEVRARIRKPLLEALFTIMRAWVLDGQPTVEVEPMRQFTPWARRVGSVLKMIGVEHHLRNLDALAYEDADEGLGLLLELLYDGLVEAEKLTPSKFSTIDAVTIIEANPAHDEVLPTWISEKVVRIGDQVPGLEQMAPLRKSLGYTFRNHARRWYRGETPEDGGKASFYRVNDTGSTVHNNYRAWAIEQRPSS